MTAIHCDGEITAKEAEREAAGLPAFLESYLTEFLELSTPPCFRLLYLFALINGRSVRNVSLN